MLLMFFTGICFVRRCLPRTLSGYLLDCADSVIADAPSIRQTMLSSCLIQIGQRAEYKQSVDILGRAAITALGEVDRRHKLDDGFRLDEIMPPGTFIKRALNALLRA